MDRRKNEFLATLGHELRNPLAPLWQAVELQKRQESADPVSSQVRDIIERQVQQLSRLADDLLDVSRIAQGKVELRMERVDLAAVMLQATETSAPHLRARHHHWEVNVPSEPIWLRADPGRLVQILVNLLNNAAKYTEPGGRIWLTGELDGSNAVIRVRDTGMGIAPKLLPHVFELFTQADWSEGQSQGGMGIGLALVRRLVDLHGGTITATSAGVGQGSEFVVTLPTLSAEPVTRMESAGGQSAEPAPRILEASPRKILVVDDNVDAAESLSMLLSVEGHQVRTAYDGLAALQLADDFQPEIIVLDIGLPRMHGYEVARRLRQETKYKDLLLVALSGYGQEDDRRRCLEAGFNAHLVKPVDLDVLRAALAHSESLVQNRMSK